MSNQPHRRDRRAHGWGAALILTWLALAAGPSYAQPTATLEWTPNTESDLQGYEIFRSLTPCSKAVEGTTLVSLTKVGTVATWPDPNLPATTRAVCYGIKALDTSNNVSSMSNLAEKLFPRPAPVLVGHWTQKTDVPHDAQQNLKYYTIHALVYPKAALVGFNPVLVKNYTYFFYASSRGYCGEGGVLAGHSSTGRACDPTPLTPLAWNVLTATYDGATLSIYRDKILTQSVASPVPLDSTDLLQIAGSKFNEVCNCDLEVWLYDQAMTSTEVTSLPGAPSNPAILAVAPTVLSFAAVAGGPDPAAQTVQITNSGTGTFAWTAVANQPWLSVTPSTGLPSAAVTVAVARGSLPAGTHLGNITIAAPDLTSVSIAVTFTVTSDVTPPRAPTDLKLSLRPTTGSAVLSWAQPGGQPDAYRVDYFYHTAWKELLRVPGSELHATVLLPEVGRRTFRICAVATATVLCNNREGIWLAR